MDRLEIVNAAAASFEEGVPLRAPSFDTERPPQPSDSFEPPEVLSIGGPITEVGINGRNDASRASEVLTGLYIPATNTAVIAGGTATHGTLLNWYLGQYETPDAVLGFKAAMDGNRDVYVEVPGGGGGLFSALSRAGLTDDIQRLKGGNITRPSYLYECLYAVRRFGVGEQATVRYGYRVVRADDGAFTTTDAYELADCYRELRFIGELPPEYVDPTGGRDLSAPDADTPRSMQLEAPSGNVPTGHTATPTPRESVASVPEEARMFTVSERTLGHARQLARLPFVFELSTDTIPASDTDTIDFLIDFPTTNRRMPDDGSFRSMSRTSISLPENGEQLGAVTFRFPPLSPDTPPADREAWRSFEGGGRLPTEDPTLFGFGNDLWPHVDWDFRDHPDITFATLIDRLREYAEAYRDIFGDEQESLYAPKTGGDGDVNVDRLLRRIRRFNFTVNARRVGSPGGTQIIQFDIGFRDRSLRDEDGRDSAILGSAITLSHGSVDTFVWRLPPVSATLITRGRLEDITTAAVAGTPLDGEVEVSIEPDSPRRNEWTPHIEDRTWPPYRDGDALLDTLQQTYRAYREQVFDAVENGGSVLSAPSRPQFPSGPVGRVTETVYDGLVDAGVTSISLRSTADKEFIEFYPLDQDPHYAAAVAFERDTGRIAEATLRFGPLGDREQTPDDRIHSLEGDWHSLVLSAASDVGIIDLFDAPSVEIDLGDAWAADGLRPHIRLYERRDGYDLAPRTFVQFYETVQRRFESRFGTLEERRSGVVDAGTYRTQSPASFNSFEGGR